MGEKNRKECCCCGVEFIPYSGLDKILEELRNEKKRYVAGLLENPGKFLWDYLFGKYLPMDEYCQFLMNREKCEKFCPVTTIEPIMKAHFICHGCRLISFFVCPCDDIVGKAFRTEVGEYMRKPLILLSNQIPIKVELRDEGEMVTRMICDKFTNMVTISWLLEKILLGDGMELVSKLVLGYRCGGVNYYLYEFPELGRLYHLQGRSEYIESPRPTATTTTRLTIKTDVVIEIFKQMVSLFHYLGRFGFSHGRACSRSLLFSDQGINYAYDGVRVKCPVTLKLSNFENSRMKFKYLPFAGATFFNEIEIRSGRFQVCPGLAKKGEYVKMTECYLFYLDYVKAGNIIFESLDFYAFFLVLMGYESFYRSFVESKYAEIWRRMWLPEEYEFPKR
jgi:hypothetical protein